MAMRCCQLRCRFLDLIVQPAETIDVFSLYASHSSHDNSKFASSGGDRAIFLWDVTGGNTIRRISGHLSKINVVDFNQEATVLASGTRT